MSNNNQILRLITILSLSFHEILCNPHSFLRELPSSRRMPMTDQCLSETSALGDIGNPATLFSDYTALINDCQFANLPELQCTYPDSMTECVEAGGQHHIVELDFACDTISATSSTFPICAGASCDINYFLDAARVDVKEAILEILSNPLFPVTTVADSCNINLNTDEPDFQNDIDVDIVSTPQPTAVPVTIPPIPLPVTVTEQCESETAAFGDIGNPTTLFTNLSSILALCTVSFLAKPATADCELPDTMAECLAGGGRHHTLDLNFACGTTFLITSSNFQVCGGASCDIDDFIDLTMNNVDQQLLDLLSSDGFLLSIDPDTCVLNSNLTESILATPNTPSGPVTPSAPTAPQPTSGPVTPSAPTTPQPTSGPVTPSAPTTTSATTDTSESNTIWNALSIYFLFMVAVPLLALV